jgi:rhodanese-related sulfurtransferase
LSPSGAEFVRQIKSQIDEVDPAEVHEELGNGAVVVDVRETEEVSAGKIPGAVHVPRGFLESRIEGAAPDRSQRVILYCASGNRSALAAKTLRDDLGYEHVESMTGGYTLWKDRGYDVEVPKQWSPEQRQRYSRHFLLPEIGEEGQQKLLDAKCCCSARAGSARRPRCTWRPPASARSASSTTTWSTSRTSSVRSSTRPTAWASRRSTRPSSRSTP